MSLHVHTSGQVRFWHDTRLEAIEGEPISYPPSHTHLSPIPTVFSSTLYFHVSRKSHPYRKRHASQCPTRQHNNTKTKQEFTLPDINIIELYKDFYNR